MDYKFLSEKASWVRKETLRIHKIAPGIRLASALSCVELLTVLYYGKVLKFDPTNIFSNDRDRFIISKAHGVVSFYPVLADNGFFPISELGKVGKPGCILGDIPDCSIPGFETVNGSLGHGLGVGCGTAIALKKQEKNEKVFIFSGDGELFEGSVWEAIMFAGHHKLDNLIMIIDYNKISMLDYCNKIIDLGTIADKFQIFGWETKEIDGHDVKEIFESLTKIKRKKSSSPQVVIAHTIKGKGVPKLEGDSLCHIRALTPEEIDAIIN